MIQREAEEMNKHQKAKMILNHADMMKYKHGTYHKPMWTEERYVPFIECDDWKDWIKEILKQIEIYSRDNHIFWIDEKATPNDATPN